MPSSLLHPQWIGTDILVTPSTTACRAWGQVISAWLCMSPCRSDHIFTLPPSRVFGVWSLRILDVTYDALFGTGHRRSWRELGLGVPRNLRRADVPLRPWLARRTRR